MGCFTKLIILSSRAIWVSSLSSRMDCLPITFIAQRKPVSLCLHYQEGLLYEKDLTELPLAELLPHLEIFELNWRAINKRVGLFWRAHCHEITRGWLGMLWVLLDWSACVCVGTHYCLRGCWLACYGFGCGGIVTVGVLLFEEIKVGMARKLDTFISEDLWRGNERSWRWCHHKVRRLLDNGRHYIV